jgi:hypothetical protein
MPLLPGFTQYHGIIMPCIEATMFRRMERHIRKHIDNGFENGASYWLDQCEQFAHDDEDQQLLCKLIRKDAADRWFRAWGKQSSSFGSTATPRQPA